jgi:hypothetical protein
MEADRELSPVARTRRDAALPGLLAEVRARARRRRTRRAAVTAALVALVLVPIAAWWLRADGAVVVHTRPEVVLARCVVASPPSGAVGEWSIGDAELQAELRALDRPAGLVRVGDRVLVDPAAADPFPTADGAASR